MGVRHGRCGAPAPGHRRRARAPAARPPPRARRDEGAVFLSLDGRGRAVGDRTRLVEAARRAAHRPRSAARSGAVTSGGLPAGADDRGDAGSGVRGGQGGGSRRADADPARRLRSGRLSPRMGRARQRSRVELSRARRRRPCRGVLVPQHGRRPLVRMASPALRASTVGAGWRRRPSGARCGRPRSAA